ncbi:MAG TPA: glycine dehydrogenase subunit 2 [Aquifex aeolicus]|uniref:Probable glycine dehydrogenase (decarboxylating) subunit 2 n=1 Tax=Aquifex aeolicus TaxID=63363 RepID=A0A9D1CF72_AQUAO|nr:glycine dehydrogenase subunit 2 [Aquifex aeolicus]HIQ25859.1 glycine dehydrogenase subunit 2 [Aquifex aeolicus]
MEKLLFELSKKGRKGVKLPTCDVEEVNLTQVVDGEYIREELDLPEVSELDTVRHFSRLSQLNFSIDTNFYPLGSCTMKYNPKVNERIASLEGFLNLHPFQDGETVQGILELAFLLKEYLKELGGFADVSLQPAAGAQGELLGLLLISAYHRDKGNSSKDIILVPDSAHGTNPASAAIAGFKVLTVKSDRNGELDWEDFTKKISDRVAALMITNPNTLGIFERKIKDIADALHERDALLYMDGANFNALIGRMRPGDWGVDVMHFNLHKTFSSPHGGGGPGSGPVGVSERLKPYLPVPQVEFDGKRYYLNWNIPKTVGKVLTFYGHTAVWVRALAYILAYGKEIFKVADYAILNARYLRKKLEGLFTDPYKHVPCMHEFVLSAVNLKKYGVKALDVAKRMLDYKVHPPTIYFPLIVPEALMIEPTETESKETLDYFAKVCKTIVGEAKTTPEKLKNAPYTTPVRRIKEAQANRQPILRF